MSNFSSLVLLFTLFFDSVYSFCETLPEKEIYATTCNSRLETRCNQYSNVCTWNPDSQKCPTGCGLYWTGCQVCKCDPSTGQAICGSNSNEPKESCFDNFDEGCLECNNGLCPDPNTGECTFPCNIINEEIFDGNILEPSTTQLSDNSYPNTIVYELPEISLMDGVFVEDEISEENPNEAPDSTDGNEGESLDDIEYKANMIELEPTGQQYLYNIPSNDLNSILNNGESTSITDVIPEFEATYDEIKYENENSNNIMDYFRRLVILGADTRWEVRGAPPGWSPPRHTGLLEFSGGSCSAALISCKHILTAGHCVHSGGRRGNWYSGFKFYPGRTRDYTPSAIGWTRVRTFRGWTVHRDYNWDIAIIELDEILDIGWVSIGYNNGLRKGEHFYHKGYSGDKPYGTQWSSDGKLWKVKTHQLRTDTTDTWFGNSGGPWYKYSGRPIIYAAHSGSGTSGILWWRTVYNRHTRITKTKFNAFLDWIRPWLDIEKCKPTRKPTYSTRSPTRKTKSPTRWTESPTRKPTYSTRSPTKKTKSPTRKPTYSTRSPTRKTKSPTRWTDSPTKKPTPKPTPIPIYWHPTPKPTPRPVDYYPFTQITPEPTPRPVDYYPFTQITPKPTPKLVGYVPFTQITPKPTPRPVYINTINSYEPYEDEKEDKMLP